MPRKPKGLKISLTEVSQTFNTKDLFKKELSSSAKKAFGERIVEEISLRTISGTNINHKPFKRYSKKYAASKGVGRNDVDMVLENKMLKSQKVVIDDNGHVKIEIGEGEDTKKAFAHNTGYEGHPFIKGPKRLFFGISGKDLKEIVKEIKSELPDKDKVSGKDFNTAADTAQGDNVTITQSRKSVKQELIDIFEGL